MKKLGLMTVAVSAVALAGAASALEYTPYLGLDYNHTIANTEGNEHYRPDYDGFSVNVGTNYNQHFGVEAFYQKTDTDNKGVAGAVKAETGFEAYGIDAMGYLPMGCDGNLSLIGTAGIGMYNFDAHIDNVKGTLHDEGVGYRLGVGAMYNINDKWAVRGIVRYVTMDKVDESINADHMMEYTAGVRYNF